MEKNSYRYISQKYKQHFMPFNDVILKQKIRTMVASWRKATKKSAQRKMVLAQWLKTEENYMRDLIIIQTNIRDPLESLKLITHDQKAIMFANIDAMVMLSQEMITTLGKLVASWDRHKTEIAEAVIYFSKFFKIYKQYCNNYLPAKELIQQLQFNKRQQLRPITSSLKMDIDSYLIKPVQRPPKYKLLLESYRKCMKDTHIDYNQLTTAIKIYHQVVQQNNKAMQLQEKKQKLLKLQRFYGNIIDSSNRYLISEKVCWNIDGNLRIFIFNNLLLVTICKDISKMSSQINLADEKLYARIDYDGHSTVRKLRQRKHHSMGLVLIGTNNYIRVHFEKLVDRDSAFQVLKRSIEETFQKKLNREALIHQMNDKRQSIKELQLSIEIQQEVLGNIQKNHNSSQSPVRIPTFFKSRTSASMTRQRNQMILNDFSLQRKLSFIFEFIGLQKRDEIIYYVVFLETPLPVQQGQYLYLDFFVLQEIQSHLNSLFPNQQIPTLGTKPPGLSSDQIKNDFIKLSQYRGLCIEQFLNYIFRNKTISYHINLVALKLGISEMLYEHMMDFDLHCKCQACKSYQDYLSLQKYTERQQFVLRQLLQHRNQRICISSSLKILFKLKDMPTYNNIQLKQILLYMNIRQKRISAPYIFTNRTLHSIKPVATLPLHMPHNKIFPIMNRMVIKIAIYPYTTCRNVLQEVSQKLNIKTLRDYGLFVKVSKPKKPEKIWILNDDEIIYQIMKNGELVNRQEQQIQMQKSLQKRLQKSSGIFGNLRNKFTDFSSKIQQIGEQMSSTMKLEFYLKKVVVLGKDIQIRACESDPNRSELIVAQILQRYSRDELVLNFRDTKQLCAYYYALKSIRQNSVLIATASKDILFKNFITQFLKQILHPSKWNFIQSQFLMQIVERVIIMRDNGILRSGDAQKNIQSIFMAILGLVSQKLSWCTEKFLLENENPKSLQGSSKIIQIGVNRNYIQFSRPNQLTALQQIPLDKFTYQIYGLSLFIETQKMKYSFRGGNLCYLVLLLEFYKNLPTITQKKIMASKLE